jgi:hypothetical protein
MAISLMCGMTRRGGSPTVRGSADLRHPSWSDYRHVPLAEDPCLATALFRWLRTSLRMSQPNVEDAGTWGSLRLSVRRFLGAIPGR